MRALALLKQVAVVLIVILIGTAIDWFAHGLSERFAVPEYYFPHKILYGTIIGSIALWVFRHWIRSDRLLAFAVTAAVAVLIQVNYYLQGYSLTFVFLFMAIHFVARFVPAFFLFPALRKTIRA